MPILAAFMVPHPPMIIPDVGKGSEKQISKTIRAYEQVADEVAALTPETIVITSPHSVMYADYFHISPGKHADGSFRQFRAPQVKFSEDYDEELAGRISVLADREEFPAGTLGEREASLDHGTMVPLWFIRKKYTGGKILRIGLSGLPLTDHYRLGQLIADAAEDLERRVVIIASGDLSHKLQTYGPYGYAPEGPEYDRRIMDVCGRAAFGELFDFDEVFCEKAAECGHRSFVIMAGAFDGREVKAQVLSHEDVTGVGYGICTFYPEGDAGDLISQPSGLTASPGRGIMKDRQGRSYHSPHQSALRADSFPSRGSLGRRFLDIYLEKVERECREKAERSDAYVRLARASVESWVVRRKKLDVPEGLPEEMLRRRAGTFVSIHKDGHLRGCIGTIMATQKNVAEEIIRNGISACANDPRFSPITPDELPRLEITVDVLGEIEDITSPAELDVKRYGVIVTSGRKRGLLLPNLDGVDTVEDQIRIAREKGGIREREKYELQRFEVVRHY